MASILEQADQTVAAHARADYGPPSQNWELTARLWSEILGFKVTPSKAVLCMIAVKIARECRQPKRDNRVDIAGYAAVLDAIEGE